MPVTVVVGGQFGSEGKGKIAQHLAREQNARAVVRVGGSNSGHTACDAHGRPWVLRQLPTAALLPDVKCVLPAGSYVDPTILRKEIEQLGLEADRLLIDSNAVVITDADRRSEAAGSLGPRIGSTCSGTGTAVAKRISRQSRSDLAEACASLRPYLGDAHGAMNEVLAAGGRIVVEGTQGFGLSLLHSPFFPHVTSRDTTAAGLLAEASLSPLDVDEVALVVRAFPIRVAGNSGPFRSKELDWETVQAEGGHDRPLAEYTSVTGRLRRVARFEPELVTRAISVNRPSILVLNHVDYVDAIAGREARMTLKTQKFVRDVSRGIGREVDYIGLGPATLLHPSAALVAA